MFSTWMPFWKPPQISPTCSWTCLRKGTATKSHYELFSALKGILPPCTSTENLIICLSVGGIVYSFYGQFWLYLGYAGPRCDSRAQTHPPPPTSAACRLWWAGSQSGACSPLSGPTASTQSSHSDPERPLFLRFLWTSNTAICRFPALCMTKCHFLGNY